MRLNRQVWLGYRSPEQPSRSEVVLQVQILKSKGTTISVLEFASDLRVRHQESVQLCLQLYVLVVQHCYVAVSLIDLALHGCILLSGLVALSIYLVCTLEQFLNH